jgi:hypothetical protein
LFSVVNKVLPGETLGDHPQIPRSFARSFFSNSAMRRREKKKKENSTKFPLFYSV